MPKQIDELKKIKYKQSRLNNNSIAKSLLNAGYKKTTAYHKQNNMTLVNVVEEELKNEFKAKDVTIDLVVKRSDLVFNKAMETKKLAAANQANKDMAEFVGIAKQQSNITNVYNVNIPDNCDSDLLTKLARNKNVVSPTIK